MKTLASSQFKQINQKTTTSVQKHLSKNEYQQKKKEKKGKDFEESNNKVNSKDKNQENWASFFRNKILFKII